MIQAYDGDAYHGFRQDGITHGTCQALPQAYVSFDLSLFSQTNALQFFAATDVKEHAFLRKRVATAFTMSTILSLYLAVRHWCAAVFVHSASAKALNLAWEVVILSS